MKGNIKIAVIDDGFHDKYFNTFNYKKIEITEDLEIIEQKNLETSGPNHGSICAGIIKKYAPNASLVSIKILNAEGRSECKQLIEAIKWCITNNIKLVNLSLGTVLFEDSYQLKKVVCMAVKKGVIIISACSNNMIVTYPTCFSNVIGVKTSNNHEIKEGKYIFNPHSDDGVEIITNGVYTLNLNNGEKYCTKFCNSFATPFITAMVYNIINNYTHISIDKLKSILIKGSLNKCEIQRPYLHKYIDWVENAVFIRINRGKTSFIQDDVIFNIIDKIDIEVNSLSEIVQFMKKFFESGNDKEFDTVVVDANVSFVNNKDEVSNIIQEIIDKDKNVVYIDDKEVFNEVTIDSNNERIKIWHPSVANKFVPVTVKIGVPIILINDLTGKYLIWLMKGLRKRFRSDGHNAVASTDVSYGIIYGMNYNPIDNNSPYNKLDPGGLKKMCGVFQPDLLLYGIDGREKKNQYYDNITSCFEIDVEIFIVDKISQKLQDCVEISKNYGHEILILSENDSNENSVIWDKLVKLKHSQIFIDEIYRYLMELYE